MQRDRAALIISKKQIPIYCKMFLFVNNDALMVKIKYQHLMDLRHTE